MLGRRSFLISAAALIADPALASQPSTDKATDEDYWARVAADFDVAHDPIPLENGNWGVMARPVLQDYLANTAMVNRRNTLYARSEYPTDLERVRARVADTLGVHVDEIALTRNATEALQTLIAGYGKLTAGDEVLVADLDYPAMTNAMGWLQRERQVRLVTIDLPEPAGWQALIDAYESALREHPKVRLMLLTHLGHRTGLILPVAEIVEMARHRGVDCIVDSAHAFGQLNITIPSLGADFIGFNLHKWFGAPIGCGGLYIAKNRLGDMRAHMRAETEVRDIRGLVQDGTANFAATLTIPAALDYRQRIGGALIESRLRYLRDRWVTELRMEPGVQVLDSSDPRLYAGIGALRLHGKTSERDNAVLATRLREEFGIMTVHRAGAAAGSVIRVSPAIFTLPGHIDRFVAAMKRLARMRSEPGAV
jgi:selenocysteine lyase/cysteine desulfurase